MADSFSLLIDDSCPSLSYFPFADTLSIPNFFEGWNPCFSVSACPTFPGQLGNGTSLHVTSLDGAAFSIQWWGNSIQLSGIAQGSITYDLQLDGRTNSSISPPASGGTVLAEYDDLQPGSHTLSLIVHNPTNSTSALIAIDHARITVNSTSPNTTFSSSVTNDTSLPFTGQWSFVDNSLLSPLDNTYHTTSHAGDFVNFNFSGTAVSVFGFRSATSGNYSVKLDNDTVTLNGVSSSEVATTLFFRAGLNNSFHTLTITNLDNSLLAIGSVNVTTASSQLVNPISGSSGSSHISRGTIAAIAVASTLGVLVFLIATFFLWRRRRQFGRILHRKRSFVAPNGNDHSKVLDIVRGPGVDDLDDMYEDKPPEDKSRQPSATNHGSESLSFTLDLPIQSRPSLRLSQRDWSGNSAQELPRSPTVSVGLLGTHPRGSSRGVPLHDIYVGDSIENDETRLSPSSIALGQATDEGILTSDSPRERETVDDTERKTFEIVPPALPRPAVVASGTAQGGNDQSQPSYSFLDISASSQASSTSVRHPGLHTSSSSSSFGSMRRGEPLAPSQRISLPFAMGFPRDPPDLSRMPPTGIEFPRISLNIRPLPQIPHAVVELGTHSSMFPTLPQRAVRPHAQSMSIPSLHVRTELDELQSLPRSVSTTTAPLISSVSGGSRVPNIVLHPSSLLRTHPRTSSVISPTESVPVTVSDIHFRHSSDDEPVEPESRRTSTAVSEHPPPHPPLPQRSYASPFIMHKLFGTPAVPPTSPGDDQISQQSPGAGPSSRLRDQDPPPSAGPSAPRQKK